LTDLTAKEPAPVGYRLSPQQRRCPAPEHGGTVQALIALHGPLDEPRLRAALESIVERHEILRTTFPERRIRAEGLQVVGKPWRPIPARHDVAGLAPPEADAAITSLLLSDRLAPFDPAAGPLLRVWLVRKAAAEHLLVASWPALVGDAPSASILLRDLAAAYAGPRAERRDEVVQVAEVAAWADEVLEGDEAEAGRAFWRRAAPEPASWNAPLPLQGEASHGDRFAPRTVPIDLRGMPAARLRAATANGELAVDGILLTAFHVLLARMRDEPASTVGVAADGRSLGELARTFGPLARVLPVQVRLPGSARVAEALAAVHAARHAALSWQDSFSWDDVASGSGLSFVSEHESRPPAIAAAGLTLSIERVDARLEPFVLRLRSVERDGEVHAWLDHDPAALDADEAGRLAARFRRLLEGLLSDPGARLAELEILGDAERQRLVVDYNVTVPPSPRTALVHEQIEDVSRGNPDAIAVVDGERRLSYGDLESRANAVARELQTKGVGPGAIVAVLLPRCAEMVVAVLGVLKAGGAYLPVDPAYPRDRQTLMLEETRARAIVTRSDLVPALPPTDAAVVPLDAVRLRAGGTSTRPVCGATPDDLAYVIYTSGSTGRPKGVMVTHRGLSLSNAARLATFPGEVGRFLLLSPLAFDSSVVGLFWTLAVGGTLVLVPEEAQRSPARLVETIVRERVTHLLTLPSFYELILSHVRPGEIDSLVTCLVAGEPCPLRLMERHRERLPGVGLFSEYGATETTVWSGAYDCLRQTIPVAPLGRPAPGYRIYLLDRSGKPVPIGVPGEVYFGGEALALGYIARPDLTAARFVPDPLSERRGARLYRSGDLARHRPDGDLEFLGRADNQVKIRGYRVELEEIESALLRHPGVGEAAVMAREDDGASGKRLVAYVTGRAGEAPGVVELRAFLKESLPEFMVPAVFVPLGKLPRTPNGKVDRRSLPVPGTARPDLLEKAVAPRSTVEARLAAIWCGVLGLDSVGVNDNFFELGGDSIQVLRVAARARQEGLEVSPRLLFLHQTVAELAAALTSSSAPIAPRAEPFAGGEIPLTPVQRWFLSDAPVEPHHFGMTLAFELRRPIDAGRLEQALAQLVQRHDALRLRFQPSGATFRQDVTPDSHAVRLERLDLEGFAPDEAQRAVEQLGERLQAGFTLAQGLLVRGGLVRGAGNPVLLLALQHLGVDAVSLRVIAEDLDLLCRRASGEAVELPASTTPFAVWARRLTASAGPDAPLAERTFWLSQHADPSLPLDFPLVAGANVESSARTVSTWLGPDETRILREVLPRSHGTFPHEALLAALGEGLAAWCGRRRLLVEMEGHGREDLFPDLDVTRSVGWFTSLFPIVLELPDGDPVATLHAAREAVRRVPRRGVGFGLLRYLSPDPAVRAALAALPRPPVNFNFLGQLDDRPADGAHLVASWRRAGAERSPRATRPNVLEVVGQIVGGRLRLDFRYSESLHRRATIEALGRHVDATLRALFAAAGGRGAEGVA